MNTKNIIIIFSFTLICASIVIGPISFMVYLDYKTQQKHIQRIADVKNREMKVVLNEQNKARREKQRLEEDNRRHQYMDKYNITDKQWGTDTVEETDRKCRSSIGMDDYDPLAVKWLYEHKGCSGAIYSDDPRWPEIKKESGITYSDTRNDDYCADSDRLYFRNKVIGGGIAPCPYEIIGYRTTTINIDFSSSPSFHDPSYFDQFRR